MVAAVQGPDHNFVAIHRTYLLADGRKAPMKPQKMMLGPCRGGAIRLGPDGDRLVVAEGIENALSAMQITGVTAWAAMSTSGMKPLVIPETVREVVIACDGDEAGRMAASRAAEMLEREGRDVRIYDPGDGVDHNDLLKQVEAAHG